MTNTQLKSLTWNLLLEWEDGVMVPIQLHLNTAMVEDGKFTNAIVDHVLKSRIPAFTEEVIRYGLDELLDWGINYGGEEPFNILLSTMLKLHNGQYVRLECVTNEPVSIRRTMVAYVREYVWLIQAFIRPPIPPEIQQQMEARKRQHEAIPTTGG